MMAVLDIDWKKENSDAKIPTKANDHAAGFDFYSPINKSIAPGCSVVISTGIAWQPTFKSELWFPYMQMKSRSGLAFKHGIEVTNAGVIDMDYRGSIGIKLYNNSKKTYHIEKGERIAQGVVHVIPKINTAEVTELSDTNRGKDGFGSTGRK